MECGGLFAVRRISAARLDAPPARLRPESMRQPAATARQRGESDESDDNVEPSCSPYGEQAGAQQSGVKPPHFFFYAAPLVKALFQVSIAPLSAQVFSRVLERFPCGNLVTNFYPSRCRGDLMLHAPVGSEWLKMRGLPTPTRVPIRVTPVRRRAPAHLCLWNRLLTCSL